MSSYKFPSSFSDREQNEHPGMSLPRFISVHFSEPFSGWLWLHKKERILALQMYPQGQCRKVIPACCSSLIQNQWHQQRAGPEPLHGLRWKKLIFLTVYWFPVLLCEDKTFHSPILPQNTCQIALLLLPTVPKTQIMKSWQSTWREHLLLSTAWRKKAEINKHSEGWSLLNCHQNSLKPFCANTGTAKLPVDRAGSCVEHTGCRKTGKKTHCK